MAIRHTARRTPVRPGFLRALDARIDRWLSGALPEDAVRYHDTQAARTVGIRNVLVGLALFAFVAFWFWDGVAQGAGAAAAQHLRLTLAIPLATLAAAAVLATGYLKRLAYVVFIGAAVGCIVAVTHRTPGGLAYALPTYMAIPLVVAPFFTRWTDLAVALVFTTALPWMGVTRGPASPATVYNYAFYLSLAVTCSLVVFAVTERARRSAHALHLKVRDLAHHDALTGVLTRRRLFELGEERVRERPWLPCSLAYLDLDRFKALNDDFGHDAGDRALEAVAGVLLRHVPVEGLVGRLGGEEFAVLLPLDEELAGVVCDDLLEAVRSVVIEGRALSTSIGLATRGSGETFSDLLTRADQALLAAKRGGRGRWAAASAVEAAGTIAAPFPTA